jgi:hypothetical protein
VSRLIDTCGHYKNTTFVKDYAGKERVVRMIKK